MTFFLGCVFGLVSYVVLMKLGILASIHERKKSKRPSLDMMIKYGEECRRAQERGDEAAFRNSVDCFYKAKQRFYSAEDEKHILFK